MSPEEIFDTDVFISYNQKDAEIAEKLSRRIRQYKPPRSIKLGKRKLKVFRDNERLTAATSLSEELKKQLNVSRWLLLLCSPNSAKSEWVNEEVLFFLNKRGIGNIIFVLVEGDLVSCIPSALKELISLPLYIDISKTGNKKFKPESLRIIAKIYGVDFMTLLREDEKRRRRIIRQAISATLIVAFILFSVYLILSVAPVFWKKIDIPGAYGPNSMIKTIPVHEIAVNKKNTDHILFLERNAFWYNEPPAYRMPPEEIPPEFRSPDTLVQSLRKNKTGILSLAGIELKISGEQGLEVNCQMKISAVIDHNEKPRYIRSVNCVGKAPGGPVKKISIPGSLIRENESPFDFGRIAELLISQNLLNNSCVSTGIITSLLTGKKTEISYDFNTDYSFSDGDYSKKSIRDEEYWILPGEGKIFPDVLGKELKNVRHDTSFWNKIKASREWITYQPPSSKEIEVYATDRQEKGNLSREIIEDLAQKSNLLFTGELKDLNCMKDDHVEVSLITTPSSFSTTMILKFQGTRDNVHANGTPTAIDWFVRVVPNNDWKHIAAPSSQIISIWALDSVGERMLLLSSDKGYFLTSDGGAAWKPANYNENGFSDGSRVKTFVLEGGRIYALIDRGENDTDEQNPLYSIEKRNWLERWRQGLIEILE